MRRSDRDGMWPAAGRWPAVAIGFVLVAVLLLQTQVARGAEVHGVPLPPGSRVDIGGGSDVFVSGRGFRDTVEYYERVLAAAGRAHRQIPVYRYRGTLVARFLSQDASSPWAAIHVFQARGRTLIYIVANTP